MISIIIPTLNEARTLPRLLDGLRRQGVPAEIVVVDGGSDDGTAELARGARVVLLRSTPGRGPQLNQGAAAARGDILLFLHADSVFPQGGLERIEEALASPTVVGGNFRLVFDGGDGFSRWLSGFYVWIRERGLYYGDSGVFVRRTVYEAMGGLRPMAVMEDYDFTRRLEAAGATCCIAEPPLVTSARRFQGRHPVAIVWGWLKIHALYHLGVAPDRLARLYDSDRRRRSRLGTPTSPLAG